MTLIRDCWRRDLSGLTPQQRRAAGYAVRLLGLPRELITERLDTQQLGLLWRMLQPLFEPRGLASYLRPPAPPGRAYDPDELDPDVPDADLDEDAAIPRMSDDDIFLALRVALKEEEESAFHVGPDRMEEHQDLLLGRLRRLFRRIHPLTAARLDRANPEEAPAAATVALLGASLDLTGPALRVLDFLDELVASPDLGQLMRQRGERAGSRINYRRLGPVLDLSETELRRALAKNAPLRSLGLVVVETGHSDLEDFLRPSDLLSEVLEAAPADAEALLELLIEPAPPAEWSLTAFPHLETSAGLAGEALEEAVARRTPGVNALLYGPPGTGKTELARALAADRGLRAYQVRSADDDGDGLSRNGRLSAYLLAQRLLGRRGAALLIFDEVEDVFDAGDNLFALLRRAQVTGRQKGWMNRILEENPVPAIWIANHTGGVDPAFLRRFLLPVACGTPPRSVRRQMAEHHLGDRGLPPDLLDDLAADQDLAPAQLGAARRLLELCPTKAPERAVREGVGAMRLLLHGAPAPRRRPAATPFDVAFLNLAGDVTPSAIVQALGRRGHGSLCFYGPPGTGKTAFAEILAAALDRELVARQASDLVSKYVGETEQNLARLFRDCDPERSVLLLDEVDSFLAERREARHRWERTQVNELLQQMERFPGIFVAATNLMSGIDQAALRRFDFKLHFRALNAGQRRVLFAREALGDEKAPVPELIARHMETLTSLTPGDFANVCRQRTLLGEDLAPEQFLRRLAAECRLKQGDERRVA